VSCGNHTGNTPAQLTRASAAKIDVLYIGGVFCWVAAVLAFFAALIFFRNKLGD
jgi:hypothetical protein